MPALQNRHKVMQKKLLITIKLNYQSFKWLNKLTLFWIHKTYHNLTDSHHILVDKEITIQHWAEVGLEENFHRAKLEMTKAHL